MKTSKLASRDSVAFEFCEFYFMLHLSWVAKLEKNRNTGEPGWRCRGVVRDQIPYNTL